MITLILNGQRQHFPTAITLADLLVQLNLTGKRIAVEKNGEIIPRSAYLKDQIKEGDRYEIIGAVGGG